MNVYIQALKKIRAYCKAVRNGTMIVKDDQKIPDFANHVYSIKYIFERLEYIVDEAFN